MTPRARLVAATFCLVFATIANAQDTRRGGFWGSAGAGYVALGAGCATCGTPTYRSGLAVYLRAGGTLKPGVGLGVQIASMTRGGDTTSVRMVVTTLIGQWHPYRSAGFYVQMGYGFATGRQDYQVGATGTRASRTGLGLAFEVGWDISVGPVNITPNVSSLVGALGDITVRAQDGSEFLLKDAIGTGYQFGISIGVP